MRHTHVWFDHQAIEKWKRKFLSLSLSPTELQNKFTRMYKCISKVNSNETFNFSFFQVNLHYNLTWLPLIHNIMNIFVLFIILIIDSLSLSLFLFLSFSLTLSYSRSLLWNNQVDNQKLIIHILPWFFIHYLNFQLTLFGSFLLYH